MKLSQLFITTGLMAVTLVFGFSGSAGLSDPEGVVLGKRIFCSHGNTVTAIDVREVDTSKTKFKCSIRERPEDIKVFWKTELPFRVVPEKLNRNIEEDVQYCIVGALEIVKGELVVTGCKDEKYFLNPNTGKIKRTIASPKV